MKRQQLVFIDLFVFKFWQSNCTPKKKFIENLDELDEDQK
jgi:hypothetical protein